MRRVAGLAALVALAASGVLLGVGFPPHAHPDAASGQGDPPLTIPISSTSPGERFDGLGAESAAAASRLLIDYPTAYPDPALGPRDVRSEILDYMFCNPNSPPADAKHCAPQANGHPTYGAAWPMLKVEIGGDTDSSVGSEPSFLRNEQQYDALVHDFAEGHLQAARSQCHLDRGYEWWLMREAKARNRNLLLSSIVLGAPGYLRSAQGDLFSEPSDVSTDPFAPANSIGYLVLFAQCAALQGTSLDTMGLWNEVDHSFGYSREYTPSWIKGLRQALDGAEAAGRLTKRVGIICCDTGWDPGSGSSSIYDDMAADPKLAAAVDVIGAHYPDSRVNGPAPPEALSSGKTLWASEDAPGVGAAGEGDWPIGRNIIKLIDLHHLQSHTTSNIFVNPFLSYDDAIALQDQGLSKANTPWSGNYKIQAASWLVAQINQATQPGWRYVDQASCFIGTVSCAEPGQEQAPDNWSIQDGRLLVGGGSPGLSKDGANWGDYTLSFDTTPLETGGGGTYAQAGWITRAQDASNDYYWLLTNYPWNGPGGGSGFLSIGGPDGQTNVPLPFDVEPGRSYHVEEKSVGDTFETWIDGKLVNTTHHSKFVTGRVGFMDNADESAYVDNVRVTAPDGTVLLSDDFSGDLSQWGGVPTGDTSVPGSYTTWRDPATGAWTTVLETVGSSGQRAVRLCPAAGDPSLEHPAQLHAMASDASTQFKAMPDISADADGCYSTTVAPDSIYTFTTVGSMFHGAAPTPPPAASAPLPYFEDFDHTAKDTATNANCSHPVYAEGDTPCWISDIEGGTQVEPCAGPRTGNCLEQLITRPPIRWRNNLNYGMVSVVGDKAWKDYEVSGRFRLDDPGKVRLQVRFSPSTDGAASTAVPTIVSKSYSVDMGTDGSCTLSRWEPIGLPWYAPKFDCADVSFGPNEWHTYGMRVQDVQGVPHMTIYFDGRDVGTYVDNEADGAIHHGAVAFGTADRVGVQFDDLCVSRIGGGCVSG